MTRRAIWNCSIFCRVQSIFTDSSDNDLVNVYPIGHDFVAATESDVIHSFDPETLETKDRVSRRWSSMNISSHCDGNRFEVWGHQELIDKDKDEHSNCMSYSLHHGREVMSPRKWLKLCFW